MIINNTISEGIIGAHRPENQTRGAASITQERINNTILDGFIGSHRLASKPQKRKELRDGANYPEYNWDDVARDSQKLPEGTWFLWMILAGRGFGKTRTGAETVMKLVASGEYKNIAIIGKNLHEARSIMVEGHSGILSTSAANNGGVKFYSSKRQIVWDNGAIGTLIGADNYESMRGRQFDLVWVDEFAKFKDCQSVWEQILFTLRLSDNPRCVMTTTPKPLPIITELSKSSFTYLTNGSTFENSSNLSARFIDTMKVTYNGTKTGKQELYGEIVLNDDANLWKTKDIRYRSIERADMQRVVIGIDPAVTTNETSAETGIIVAGLGNDNKIYVLDDLSGKYKPAEWAKIVSKAYYDYDADRVVAEVNNGGDLVEGMIKNVSEFISYKSVRAIRGKVARAEPIALLYESSCVYHSKRFKDLEKQMCFMSHDGQSNKAEYNDRVDALVWTISEIRDKKNQRVSIGLL